MAYHGMMAWRIAIAAWLDAMNSERFALRWSLGFICALQLCFQKFTRAWTRDSSELATGVLPCRVTGFVPDQASLPQPQNRKPIKTAPCTLCKPDVPWNQNDKFIAGPWAKLMRWCFFGSNPWDLSNTSPIWIFSPDAIHWDAMDCTAAPQVIEPLEMTQIVVLSRHFADFGILELCWLCWLCWLCYTASRVNFFWIPLSVQRHEHDIWAMISEAPEGTAELHTLRYQMGATKRRRLSSRRR